MRQLRKIYTFSFPSTIKKKKKQGNKKGERSDFKQICGH